MRSGFVLAFPSSRWVMLTKALPLPWLPHMKKKELNQVFVKKKELNQVFVKRPSMLHDPEESYHQSSLPEAKMSVCWSAAICPFITARASYLQDPFP